jgi:ATP-dependent DNA helicase DinG
MLPYPALHASHGGVWLATPEETRAISRGEAIRIAADTPVILLNAPLIGQRLGYAELSGLDLLELFAFLHPARFMVPTPKGLARVTGLEAPAEDAEVAGFLRQATEALLTLAKGDWPEREGAWHGLQSLFRLRWPWAPALSQAIAKPERAERWLFSKLPEWTEQPPRVPPRTVTLSDTDIADRLARLTGSGAERRQGQRDYAAAAAGAFSPRDMRDSPNLVLAEAGTGIGKTLGYLAPASLWAEQAGGAVWVSTFTKALQRQLGHEGERLIADPELRKKKIVTRKGRENYACLLNLEDALQGGFQGRAAILAQLIARWAAYTADGDMIGGDLPGWLPTLFRRNGSTALTDRRGECIYAGCPHYRKCFIERAARASADADIVIANHALVMVNAARGRETANRPTRYVFDEGHHLFDAADAMFAAALTGQEAIEIRRWVTGPESGSRGRRRGLAARLSDVASYDEEGGRAISEAVDAARALPSDQWLQRLGDGDPFGPIEASARGGARPGLCPRCKRRGGCRLWPGDRACRARRALWSRRPDPPAPRSMHWSVLWSPRPPPRGSARRSARLDGRPRARPDRGRDRLAGLAHRYRRRLAGADRARSAAQQIPNIVDWLAVDRVEGREYDVGLHRHWLDPSRPFARTVLEPAHGALVTSATLARRRRLGRCGGAFGRPAPAPPRPAFRGAEPVRLRRPGRSADRHRRKTWRHARARQCLCTADRRVGAAARSACSRRFVVCVRSMPVSPIAWRVRDCRLLAQHVDPIDTGTLVDIFRDDPRASLIGTDALRDGVDVPGDSLRLVVMEGMPWPKPSVLHAAQTAGGGRHCL